MSQSVTRHAKHVGLIPLQTAVFECSNLRVVACTELFCQRPWRVYIDSALFVVHISPFPGQEKVLTQDGAD